MMLIIAFICFLGLVVGWFLAPASPPRDATPPVGSAVTKARVSPA